MHEWDDEPAETGRPMPSATRTAEIAAPNRSAALVPFFCVLAAIATIAAAGLLWVTSPSWGNGDKLSTAVRNVGEVPVAATAPATSKVAETLVSPIRLEIPHLHAVAPIVTVHTLANHELDVPLDPKVVGWWDGGVKPGSNVGSAVLDGHINYNGVDGVLAQIGSLNPGDALYVYGFDQGKQEKLHYTVRAVRTYVKHALPYQEIFDQHVAGRLVIVTCGGPFDAQTGNYLDNIVVYATLA